MTQANTATMIVLNSEPHSEAEVLAQLWFFYILLVREEPLAVQKQLTVHTGDCLKGKKLHVKEGSVHSGHQRAIEYPFMALAAVHLGSKEGESKSRKRED